MLSYSITRPQWVKAWTKEYSYKTCEHFQTSGQFLNILMWISYVFDTHEVEMSCYKIRPAKKPLCVLNKTLYCCIQISCYVHDAGLWLSQSYQRLFCIITSVLIRCNVPGPKTSLRHVSGHYNYIAMQLDADAPAPVVIDPDLGPIDVDSLIVQNEYIFVQVGHRASYIYHKISIISHTKSRNLKSFSSRLAVVFMQSVEARC